MSTKLNWEYEPAEDASIAWHNGYRIKAVRDESAEEAALAARERITAPDVRTSRRGRVKRRG